MRKYFPYLTIFIGVILFVALAPFPDRAGAFGNEWVPYTHGTWGFDSESHPERWQEVVYQSQQRIRTWWVDSFNSRGIELYNTSTGRGFPLAFDSECTPDTGATCNRDGDWIGHNGNTANASPLPARDYYNNHDESWSWYRNVDWRVDFRFRGRCGSGNCSGLGNNFLYAQTRENRTGFAVGYNMHERRWFYTHDNSTSYLGSYDTQAHTARVDRVWNRWYFWVDGGNHRNWNARQTSPDSRGDRVMTNLNIGNLQQVNARWPEVSLDYVNVYYALPDAAFTSTAPNNPIPAGTNVRINTWSGDIRGTGTINYYVNTASNGSASGTWINFANVNASGNRNYNTAVTLNCGSTGVCNAGQAHLVVANTYDVYGNRRQQWNIETRLQTVLRWTNPPTPTPRPTFTPTPRPDLLVRIENPAGNLVRRYMCEAGGNNSRIQERNWCPTGRNIRFFVDDLTDRWRIGAHIDPGGDVVVGTRNESGGGAFNRWSNHRPNYSWPRWYTGRRQVTFIVASPTPTPRPTPRPDLLVRIENPAGNLVSRYMCEAGGNNSRIQERNWCPTSNYIRFYVDDLTDRTRMGAHIDPGGDVVVGTRNESGGGAFNRWSNYRPNYSWPRWYTGRRQVTFIIASPTPTRTPTPRPTFTPTPRPDLLVRIENPAGNLVSRYMCEAGGNNSQIQERNWCPTSNYIRFYVDDLTDRTRIGAHIDPDGDVVVGTRNESGGGVLNRWNNYQPNYSWPRWYTGRRQVTFVVASPTPTPTPTATPSPTPVATATPAFTPELHAPGVTPVAYIDTTNTGTDPNALPTPPGGGPVPTPTPGGGPAPASSGLTLSDFYYPLQVWLRMVPTVGVSQPAEWCLDTCYQADTRPVSYTYIGMSRADGQLVATTPYTESFDLTAPYSFTTTQYINLFWEFPNIDDEFGLNPPDYYYTEQVPGIVDFYYRVRLRHTWSAAQTAAWPAVMSPMPPCAGWGGPGTACSYEQDIIIGPSEPLNLRMRLLRPVIERID